MPIKLRKSRHSLLLFIFVFILSDWAFASREVIYKDMRPQKLVTEAKREEGKKDSTSEENKEEDYLYDPTGKTDPFKSFIAKQEEIQEKKPKKQRTYLETLDLSQLELIAIMLGQKGNWAMVRDSKGLGHVIKAGTGIGTNGGVVLKIIDREVIIREEYTDFRGNKTHKDVSKKIPVLR